ncbi:hypothetical protein EON65_03510 [archaeon]|nr:MAG: hypothetical protein EON65_03510 [archaeon]
MPIPIPILGLPYLQRVGDSGEGAAYPRRARGAECAGQGVQVGCCMCMYVLHNVVMMRTRCL